MAGAWSAMDPLAALSSDDSSSEDEGQEEDVSTTGSSPPEKVYSGKKTSNVEKATEPSKQGVSTDKKGANIAEKRTALDYGALSRHGYLGGPSILHVPAPGQEVGEQDWSWSSGKRKGGDVDVEESAQDRNLTRKVINDSLELKAVQAVAEYNFSKKQKSDAVEERKALSFSQKEKRKREMGQASRAKNYVEEEKRLLRDQGVYSGFDT